jgi:hypothetical protein
MFVNVRSGEAGDIQPLYIGSFCMFFTQKAWRLRAVLGEGQLSSAGAPSCSNVPEYDVTGVLRKGGHFRNRDRRYMAALRKNHSLPIHIEIHVTTVRELSPFRASQARLPHSNYCTVLYVGATRA